MEKIKNAATIVIFAAVLFGLCAAFFIMPDNRHSRAERRLLARPPALNAEAVFSGEYMKSFETYMQDQFPLREPFRTVNALTRRHILRQLDYNGYYYAGGHLSEMEFPLNTQAVTNNALWLYNLSSSEALQNANVYYSIIPDKNYFLAAQHGFLSLDYSAMLDIVHEKMVDYTYIDLFGVMKLSSFYRTDIHWRQEELFPAAWQLATGMGVEMVLCDAEALHTLSPFYGGFHGHAALPVRPDELRYLTNQYTDNAIVHTLAEENRAFAFSRYIEADGERLRLEVYNPALFNGMDSYDVFLAGAQAIITIEIPDATTDRELIIFRDSYGSSIAPLLLGGYSKITLVDIRYIPNRVLSNYIEFDNQDILFLYNSMLMNRSGLFR